MEKEDIPLIATPHRHDSYSINLLLSGRVTVYIDFEKHDVEGPAIISMGPQQVHQYENVEELRYDPSVVRRRLPV